MNLRLSTILCCAIIAGIATVASSASKTDEYLDVDTEASGDDIDLEEGSTDIDGDTEGSADYSDEIIVPRKINPIHKTPDQPVVVDSTTPKTTTSTAKITTSNDDLEIVETEKAPTSVEDHISFFAQPGILAAIVGGALVGLLCAILVVMFIVYRMRKKDEGSYALDERKRSSTPILYGKGDGKELYA